MLYTGNLLRSQATGYGTPTYKPWMKNKPRKENKKPKNRFTVRSARPKSPVKQEPKKIDRFSDIQILRVAPAGTFPAFTPKGLIPGLGNDFNPLKNDYSSNFGPYTVKTKEEIPLKYFSINMYRKLSRRLLPTHVFPENSAFILDQIDPATKKYPMYVLPPGYYQELPDQKGRGLIYPEFDHVRKTLPNNVDDECWMFHRELKAGYHLSSNQQGNDEKADPWTKKHFRLNDKCWIIQEIRHGFFFFNGRVYMMSPGWVITCFDTPRKTLPYLRETHMLIAARYKATYVRLERLLYDKKRLVLYGEDRKQFKRMLSFPEVSCLARYHACRMKINPVRALEIFQNDVAFVINRYKCQKDPLNRAYMVHESSKKELLQQLEAFFHKLQTELTGKYYGPAPPYAWLKGQPQYRDSLYDPSLVNLQTNPPPDDDDDDDDEDEEADSDDFYSDTPGFDFEYCSDKYDDDEEEENKQEGGTGL